MSLEGSCAPVYTMMIEWHPLPFLININADCALIQTYSFEVCHVGGTDWRSDEAQIVDAGFLRAVLVVLNEHLPHNVHQHLINTVKLQCMQSSRHHHTGVVSRVTCSIQHFIY